MNQQLIPLPTGFNWRECWDFRNYSGSIVMPMVSGGHKLTATGARKGTTTDGVVFTGTATSNMVVAADAVLNNQAKFAVTIRFKRNTTFAAGAAADEYLLNKVVGGAYIRVRLESADGKLYWEGADGIGGTFSLTSTTVSWTAGTWYVVTLSLSDTGPAQRLLVNGVLEDSDSVAAFNTPNGGDLIISSSSDGGTDGFLGTISWVAIVTDALTGTEETDYSKGTPTSDVVNMYLLDESEGNTCNDRGSGADNATLDTACTWNFSGAQQCCGSLDGINDLFTSDAGVGISGASSLVVVTKAKNTLDTALAASTLALLRIDASNYLQLAHANGADGIVATAVGSGTSQTASHTTEPAIGDYRVYIMTLTAAGVLSLYVNGALAATQAGVGAVSGASATGYLGATNTPANYTNDALLQAGLVNGALSATQVLQLSRAINSRYALGLSI